MTDSLSLRVTISFKLTKYEFRGIWLTVSYFRNIGKYEYGVSLIYETEFLSDLKLDIPFLKSAKKQIC